MATTLCRSTAPRRSRAFSLAGLVLSLVLAACGGGDLPETPARAAANGLVSPGSTPATVTNTGAGASAEDQRKQAFSTRPEGPLTDEQALAYIASYPDLILAFGANPELGRQHWAGGGRAEGREILFKPLTYIASYPDLVTAFGTDGETATRQYIRVGIAQGRSVRFDGLQYLARNPDVAVRLSINPDAAALDYITSGFAAGRPAEFNGLAYIAAYADLIGRFGQNVAAGIVHYIETGLAEGRNRFFNAAQYLANYADLSAAFGSDLDAATRHYIAQGRSEGRSDTPLGGNLPVTPPPTPTPTPTPTPPSPTNRAPVAVITPPAVTAVSVGNTITLAGAQSSDPDGGQVQYIWTLRSRPAGSTAQLGSPTSVRASLSPDVAGSYLVELIVSDGQASSSAAVVGLSAGVAVSSTLTASGAWTPADSPIVLSGPLIIPAGITLTVQAGVEVRGNRQPLQVQGSLIVEGAAQNKVKLNDVVIVPAGASEAAPHRIEIRHATIEGGSLYAPTPGPVVGSLQLFDSSLNADEHLALNNPLGANRIERNFFQRGRISYRLSGASSLVIKNNHFSPSSSSPNIENLAMSPESSSELRFNTFSSIIGTAVALPAGFPTARLDAASNYWGTTSAAAIERLIFDRNDDLNSGSVVVFEPFLTGPHPDTPP